MEDCLGIILNKIDYNDKLQAKNVNKLFYRIIMNKKEDLILKTHEHSPKKCQCLYILFYDIYKNICLAKHIYICGPRLTNKTKILNLLSKEYKNHYEYYDEYYLTNIGNMNICPSYIDITKKNLVISTQKLCNSDIKPKDYMVILTNPNNYYAIPAYIRDMLQQKSWGKNQLIVYNSKTNKIRSVSFDIFDASKLYLYN